MLYNLHMKYSVLILVLIFFLFLLTAFAEDFEIFGGVQFGDSKEVVREKMVMLFDLSSFKKYHKYQIGQGKYRILFKYKNDGEQLKSIRIYGGHFKANEFRKRGRAEWKDLDELATKSLGSGFGDIPHFLDIKDKQSNYFKDWQKGNIRADLGIQKDQTGYFVDLIITEIA